MKKTFFIAVMLTIPVWFSASFLKTNAVFAQPGGGSGGEGGPEDGDPGGVPIDGGASLLAGAAVIYGAKKLKDKSKKKEEQ